MRSPHARSASARTDFELVTNDPVESVQGGVGVWLSPDSRQPGDVPQCGVGASVAESLGSCTARRRYTPPSVLVVDFDDRKAEFIIVVRLVVVAVAVAFANAETLVSVCNPLRCHRGRRHRRGWGITRTPGARDSYFFRVPYGLWLVGFSEMPRSDARD